jgi:hypothetical protein
MFFGGGGVAEFNLSSANERFARPSLHFLKESYY